MPSLPTRVKIKKHSPEELSKLHCFVRNNSESQYRIAFNCTVKMRARVLRHLDLKLYFQTEEVQKFK